MRRPLLIASVLLTAIALAAPASAKPRKGFHTGPYLAFQIGTMQATFDHDQVTGADEGRSFEPCFGFLFGWNIWDSFSAELQGRYATNLNSGRRMHLAAANVYAKGTLITDALTDFPTLRILPFAKAGVAAHISALPSAPGASSNTVGSYGIGPSVGLGIDFIWKKYFYFGIDLQEEFMIFDSVHQTVNGVPNTLVYKGGFYPLFGAMATLGVHY